VQGGNLNCLLAGRRHRNDPLNEQNPEQEAKTDLHPHAALFVPASNRLGPHVFHRTLPIATFLRIASAGSTAPTSVKLLGSVIRQSIAKRARGHLRSAKALLHLHRQVIRRSDFRMAAGNCLIDYPI
jgi:hypothetical protein